MPIHPLSDECLDTAFLPVLYWKCMNLSNLAKHQEAMRERWSDRRRNPLTGKHVPAETVERIEIERFAERTDLTCKFCRKNQTVANKRTGEIKPCKSCAQRNAHLKRVYGITLRVFLGLMSSQSGRCAICRDERWDDLVVDQCSDLGHVRGLLCRDCHDFIRSAKETDEILRNAVNYLKYNTLRGGWTAAPIN